MQLIFNLISEPTEVSVQDGRSWLGLLETAISDRSPGSLFAHLSGVAGKETRKSSCEKCQVTCSTSSRSLFGSGRWEASADTMAAGWVSLARFIHKEPELQRPVYPVWGLPGRGTTMTRVGSTRRRLRLGGMDFKAHCLPAVWAEKNSLGSGTWVPWCHLPMGLLWGFNDTGNVSKLRRCYTRNYLLLPWVLLISSCPLHKLHTCLTPSTINLHCSSIHTKLSRGCCWWETGLCYTKSLLSQKSFPSSLI